MKKIALVLRGISYLKDYTKNGSRKPVTIDFRMSVPSIQTFVIDQLKKEGFDVDVFLLTYVPPGVKENDHREELVKYFNPKKIIFNAYDENCSGPHCTWKISSAFFAQAVDNVYTDPISEGYDFMFIMRFDMVFFTPVSSQLFSDTAVTSLFPRDDSLFIVPTSLMKGFRNACQSIFDSGVCLHEITNVLHHLKVPTQFFLKEFNGFDTGYFRVLNRP